MVQDVLSTITLSDNPVIQFRPLSDYAMIRETLITSFSMQQRAGLIARARNKRLTMTMMNVLQRVELESYWKLYIAPSSLQREGFDLGNGLFAGMRYRPSSRIVHFRGELVGREVYDMRTNQMYGVKMGLFVIDCYKNMQRKVCKVGSNKTN
jgi:hypothetical protein